MADPDAPPPMTSAQRLQWQGWQRRVQVHGEAMRLREQGVPIRQIARALALSRNTVRRWVRGEQPELHRPRTHSLDPWRPVLERRWAEGCRNGARLWRDLRCSATIWPRVSATIRIPKQEVRCSTVGSIVLLSSGLDTRL
jgi:hypothetical protein